MPSLFCFYEPKRGRFGRQRSDRTGCPHPDPQQAISLSPSPDMEKTSEKATKAAQLAAAVNGQRIQRQSPRELHQRRAHHRNRVKNYTVEYFDWSAFMAPSKPAERQTIPLCATPRPPCPARPGGGSHRWSDTDPPDTPDSLHPPKKQPRCHTCSHIRQS